ncbi:hypothetical protein ATANTOWER_007637, partial [Ataeniobius toweri]|nr:hypothetical protein [Ataeniobius toweri]
APKGAGSERQKKRRHVGRGGSQLEVVLETLLEFCQEYGESVESAAVRVSIGSFSKNAKAQLMEKVRPGTQSSVCMHVDTQGFKSKYLQSVFTRLGLALKLPSYMGVESLLLPDNMVQASGQDVSRQAS